MDNLDQLDEIQNEEIPHGQPNQEEEFAQYYWQFMWSASALQYLVDSLSFTLAGKAKKSNLVCLRA